MKPNFSILIFVVCLVVIHLMTGCSSTVSHPSDEVLEQRLRSHQADFDNLVRMLEEDSDVVSITYKNVFLAKGSTRNLPKERLDEYRRFFNKLQLEGGIQRDREGFILLIASTKGMVIPNSGKTYLYAVTEPSPLVESVDEVIRSDRGRPTTCVQETFW